MEGIGQRLLQLEDRLQRILASGWRNAGAEATALAAEAAACSALGLEMLAGRLQAVAAAANVEEALPAVSLALASCRLLRARLETDVPSPSDWQPLTAPAAGSRSAAQWLLPVGRLPLEQQDVWACVGTRSRLIDDVVLIEPPPQIAGQGGVAPFEFRDGIEGELHFRGRYPVGAAHELMLYAVHEPARRQPSPAVAASLAAFRQALAAGALENGQLLLGTRGPVSARQLAHGEAGSLVWTDPAAAAVFEAQNGDSTWALVWSVRSLTIPLVLLVPGGPYGTSKLVHLIPGSPVETLTSPE